MPGIFLNAGQLNRSIVIDDGLQGRSPALKKTPGFCRLFDYVPSGGNGLAPAAGLPLPARM